MFQQAAVWPEIFRCGVDRQRQASRRPPITPTLENLAVLAVWQYDGGNCGHGFSVRSRFKGRTIKREKYFYVFGTGGKRREKVFPAAYYGVMRAYIRRRKKLTVATGWKAEMRQLSTRFLRELQKQLLENPFPRGWREFNSLRRGVERSIQNDRLHLQHHQASGHSELRVFWTNVAAGDSQCSNRRG